MDPVDRSSKRVSFLETGPRNKTAKGSREEVKTKVAQAVTSVFDDASAIPFKRNPILELSPQEQAIYYKQVEIDEAKNDLAVSQEKLYALVFGKGKEGILQRTEGQELLDKIEGLKNKLLTLPQELKLLQK